MQLEAAKLLLLAFRRKSTGQLLTDLSCCCRMEQVAEVSTLFDDDGILVRFMNSDTQGNAVMLMLWLDLVI
jgi:hypothetical protein